MSATDVRTTGSSTAAPVDAGPPLLTPDGAGSGVHGARTDGVVTGRPRAWLRVEGLAVAVAALAVFATTGQPWWLVLALFLVPDLSALGYLAGPEVGAWTYNLAHTATLPLALLAAAAVWDSDALTVAGAVGLFHLGADRVLGYGVKYDHDPATTHLGSRSS